MTSPSEKSPAVRAPVCHFLPVTFHFWLAGCARIHHNTPQIDTSDEAATNRLEPLVGRTDMARWKMRRMCEEVRERGEKPDRIRIKQAIVPPGFALVNLDL